MSNRREFLTSSAGVVGFGLSHCGPAPECARDYTGEENISLCGEWLFRIDPDDQGTKAKWFGSRIPNEGWRKVVVPHTWQVEPEFSSYRGVAWYIRQFDVQSGWQQSVVRMEFEGVFHSATVWINGVLVGEHARKGYTAFTFDITKALRWRESNSIVVRVDNAFNPHMLPRGTSSDWANDGGIFRPVQLLVTPTCFVERVDVDAVPDFAGQGRITVKAYVRNAGAEPWSGTTSSRIIDEGNSNEVLAHAADRTFSVRTGAVEKLTFETTLPQAKLWHFDHPNLYRLEFSISGERGAHSFTTTFGVRKLEIKADAFYLNGDRVRLMGVERMAGSNPEFGMAETANWISHDLSDMKNLNCVFTRVHWPQDKRVLDYCDRRGILMQSEVPVWGWETFRGMQAEPADDIMENGLEQLREMIERDRNHPSIVVWGLCNEIGGQNPPAYQFAKRMLEQAKRLDAGRLCSYASNSLQSTPQKDVAGLMDFIETNEYYGTWVPGTAEDAARNLDEIHAAFPGKPIVVSEYGYCACAPDRPEGDRQRMEILRSHTAAFRSKDFVGGAIFFCYNDYRTHVGDRGTGPLQQRVHGVVDLYAARRPSYDVLRREASPIESLGVERDANVFRILITTSGGLPMYTLRGYKLRGLFFGEGNIPVERQEVELPDTDAGDSVRLELAFTTSETPIHVQIDVLRPTLFSAYSVDWKP
jgi:beta-glucuronidase